LSVVDDVEEKPAAVARPRLGTTYGFAFHEDDEDNAAPHAGTVAELLYAPGDQVSEGAELLKLQAA
ncbi:MAG: hypothetical protein ACOVQL_14520, partial [Limnohabitans sp.]